MVGEYIQKVLEKAKKSAIFLLVGLLLFILMSLGLPICAHAYQDYIWVYSDANYTQEATSFGDGDRVYVKVIDYGTNGASATITVTNDTTPGYNITVTVNRVVEAGLYVFKGSFVVHSGMNEPSLKLHLFDEETATITADLDGDDNKATKQIIADYSSPTFISASFTGDATLEVAFSESLSAVDYTKFTSVDFTAVAGQVKSTDSTVVLITIFSLGNTAKTSNDLDIAVGAVTDVSGNAFASLLENQSINDGQSPQFVSASFTSDTTLEVTFSESFSAVNYTKFTSSNFTATAGIVKPGDDTVALITINSLNDTSKTSSDLSIGAGAVTDTSNNSFTPAVSGQVIADDQPPTFVSASFTSDTTLEVVFDEPLLAVDYTKFTSTDFTATAGVVKSSDNTVALITINSLGNTAKTSNDLDIAAGAVTDTGGNSFTSAVSGESIADKQTPSFSSAEISGTAQIRVTFTESLDVTTVDASDFTVDGAVPQTVGTTNNPIITLTMDTPFSTDVTPTVAIASGGSVSDAAGNAQTSGSIVASAYDTTPPASPYFEIGSGSSTGKVVISGTTEADAEVEIFLNGSSRGTAAADVNGDFSKEITLVLGDNFITVQAADKAGNKSSLSEPLKLSYRPENLLSIVVRSTHVVRSGSPTEPIVIFYSVSQSALVTICIYNLKGELVKEWSQQVSPGGEPSWSWYGRNMYEENVNNGVYILRVTASAGSESENVTKLVGVLR